MRRGRGRREVGRRRGEGAPGRGGPGRENEGPGGPPVGIDRPPGLGTMPAMPVRCPHRAGTRRRRPPSSSPSSWRCSPARTPVPRGDHGWRPRDAGGHRRRHGVSVQALARANGIADPDRVTAGRTLRLPGSRTRAHDSRRCDDHHRSRRHPECDRAPLRHDDRRPMRLNGLSRPDLIVAGARRGSAGCRDVRVGATSVADTGSVRATGCVPARPSAPSPPATW